MVAGNSEDLYSCAQQPPHALLQRRHCLEPGISAFDNIAREQDRIYFLFNRVIGSKLQRSRWRQISRIDSPR